MDHIVDDVRFRYAVLKAAMVVLERRVAVLPRREVVATRMTLSRRWLELDQEQGSAISHPQAAQWLAGFGAKLGFRHSEPEESLLLFAANSRVFFAHPEVKEAVAVMDRRLVA